MNEITFSGLASGLDTKGIVDQLVSIERSRAASLRVTQSNTGQTAAIVTDLMSSLKGISTELGNIDSPSEIGTFLATSSDEAQATITASSAANPAAYNLRVDQLAKGEATASAVQADTAGPGVIGTIDITVGSAAAITVNYSATDSLNDIASSINDSAADVQASVLDLGGGNGYRLVISSDNVGADSAISFAETGGNLGLTDPANELVAAQDAQVTVNGVTITRPTNVMSDVFTGVTITLNRETGTDAPTDLKVSRDIEGTRGQMQTFVDAYNDTVGKINAQLSYDGVRKGSDTLFGDSTLQSLQRSLGSITTSAFPNGAGTISLGQLGVGLGSDGLLTIDDAKFDAAYNADPKALESILIGTGTGGLVKSFDDLVTTYTRSGDGVLVVKKDGIDARSDLLQEQIDTINTRADKLGERLSRQFAALETTMVRLQAQQSSLAALFTGNGQ